MVFHFVSSGYFCHYGIFAWIIKGFEIVGPTHNGATILPPNTKVLDFQGLFCAFIG
jgi:hypothetical protein